MNQAALARGQTKAASACWAASAIVFVLFLLIVRFSDRVLQVEVGYLGAALLLGGLLYWLYERGESGSPEAA